MSEIESVGRKIWDLSTEFERRTMRVIARFHGGEIDEDGLEIGEVELLPVRGGAEPGAFVFGLRARGATDSYYFEYEECLRVEMPNRQEVTVDEMTGFAVTHGLPYLTPYVEVGFARLCREVGEEPPAFPAFVMGGEMYMSQQSSDDGDDGT